MSKITPPPDDSHMVLTVMRKYVSEKGWYYSDTDMELLAEACFLHFDSLGWKSIKFWPSVAKRWIVNDMRFSKKKQPNISKPIKNVEQDNITLKDRIKEQLERRRREGM